MKKVKLSYAGPTKVKDSSTLGAFARGCAIGSALALALLGASANAIAKERVLHTLDGVTEGSYPWAGLLSDGTGNFFGTATHGGDSRYCNGFGCGTVFKIAPDGSVTVLHTFIPQNYSDGAVPYGDLIEDSAGNLYGTTYEGGAINAGTVFELAPDGTETVLYSFTGGSDGANPESALIRDGSGTLYGTTPLGGIGCCNGTVFSIAPNGAETTLYKFTGGADGGEPQAGLIKDKAGNFYGTTYFGGSTNCYPLGCGVVFKLAPGGTETVLYAFQGGTDGAGPAAMLIRDSAGNFYSTTGTGGATGNGTVFKLSPNGTETVLYSFQGGNDGATPSSALKMDKQGNLYGTTDYGGAGNCGTVFKLAPDGTETILYSFRCGADGSTANARLTSYRGHLYSTTTYGGSQTCYAGCGVIFSIRER